MHTNRVSVHHLPRPSRRLFLLLPLLALLTLACSPEQAHVYSLVNAERTAAGVPELLPSPHAMRKAQAWAEEMASSEWLRHSDVRRDMPEGFQRLGENVGRGPTIEAVHQAFLHSPAHRANLLDARFQWIGTGHAVSAGGAIYVVHVLARY